METLELLQRRISATQQLHALMHTMKVLSAVNLHRYRAAVASLTDYLRPVELGLQAALATNLAPLAPARRRATAHAPAIYAVFGSGQGLCGPFNAAIALEAAEQIERQAVRHPQRRVVAIGARASAELSALGVAVDDELPPPASLGAVTERAQLLLDRLEQHRQGPTAGELAASRVLLIHQSPRDSVDYRPRVVDWLAAGRRGFGQLAARDWPTRQIPKLARPPDELLPQLVRQRLFVGLYRAFIESLAAENAARLAAMQSAERHAEELLGRLQDRYRRARQGRITEELLDVISGFEALRRDREDERRDE